jgi:hypothetical protein
VLHNPASTDIKQDYPGKISVKQTNKSIPRSVRTVMPTRTEAKPSQEEQENKKRCEVDI